uniref:hypothetical protein n=1 Tax=Enterocloster aldenensis TaxID=358742 RepID=UPI0011C41FDB
MRKIAGLLIGLTACVALLSGCTKNTLSYMYNVETGDAVKVTIDRMEGYDMDSNNPFTVTLNDEDILTCQFLSEEGYEYYEGVLTEENLDSQGGSIIETGKKGTADYIFYTVGSGNAAEHDFFVKLNDKTSVIIGSLSSEEEAKAGFDALSFEIVK